MIPRPSLALIKELQIEYQDNVGHPNYHRLIALLLRRFRWEKMSYDCKSHCQHCVVCKRAKPDRRGGAALQPLGILEYPRETVGIDYVIDLPKSGTFGYTNVFTMVCHPIKIAHFVSCHKENNAEEATNLL